jgi:hypothetical protein
MRNAKQLLEDFIKASWRDPKVMVGLFAEDGALELPYLTDFGYPERFAGAEGISGFTEFLQDTFPGLQLENLKIFIETPDQVFAEYEFTAISTKTGRKVHQLFFARLVAENGKIKLVREAMNSAEVARAVFKQGIPELPPPGRPLRKPARDASMNSSTITDNPISRRQMLIGAAGIAAAASLPAAALAVALAITQEERVEARQGREVELHLKAGIHGKA